MAMRGLSSVAGARAAFYESQTSCATCLVAPFGYNPRGSWAFSALSKEHGS